MLFNEQEVKALTTKILSMTVADDAKRYEAGIKSGKIAMGLSPRSDDDGAHLEREWAASGQHVYRRTSAPSGRTAQVAAERG